ncbi:TPA: hypothetical protein ACYESM_004886 [Klebsiella pneumoniae]
MFENNFVLYIMIMMIVILSYMLFKSLKSKKRLQHKYDEVFKAFHIANSEYTAGLKDVYKNLSLSNAQLQFLAVTSIKTLSSLMAEILCAKKRMMFSIFFHLYQTAIFGWTNP